MANRRSKPQRLAAKLLAIRQHLGVSQQKMMKLLETDLAYNRISEWEIGRREPNFDVAFAVRAAGKGAG